MTSARPPFKGDYNYSRARVSRIRVRPVFRRRRRDNCSSDTGRWTRTCSTTTTFFRHGRVAQTTGRSGGPENRAWPTEAVHSNRFGINRTAAAHCGSTGLNNGGRRRSCLRTNDRTRRPWNVR